MKFLTLFAALIAVACGQHMWTMPQLSAAINDPNVDPTLLPHFVNALNNWMTLVHAGQQIESIAITIPAVDLSNWSMHELSEALQNPETDPALVPHLEQALNQVMEALVSGVPVAPAAVAVATPAMEVTPWTLQELSVALQDPATNPELVPYLEAALNHMMQTMWDGHLVEVVAVVTPAGLFETPAEVVPVVVAPAETPVEAPVETPAAPASPSSPLVQIILNINQQ